MAQVTATFETGTNGNTLSTGDAGSATAFDAIDASGPITYDNTHAYDALAAKTSGTAESWFAWTTALGGTLTDTYGRAYVYMTAYPAVAWTAVRMNGVTNMMIQILGTGAGANNGAIQVIDNAGAGSFTTQGIVLNQWNRIEFHIACNVSTGTIEAKLFKDASGTVADDTVTRSGVNTSAGITEVRFGNRSGTSAGNYWLDYVLFGANSYPGPITAPEPQVLSMLPHISGHGVW